MKNKFKLGFSVIEIVIALAIVAIIGALGYASYQGSLTRANEETAKHRLINLMQEMEKYYTTHGAYSESSSIWPAVVSQKVTSLNADSGELYTYTIYPLEPIGNEQAVCINATPRSNTVQDNNSQLLIDEQNIIAVNSVIPTKCLAVLIPPAVNQVANACFNADGTQKAYSQPGGGCKQDENNNGSGGCDGKTISGCKGNCNGVFACGPSGVGCNGNCVGSFVYNAPCGGVNCDGATVYIGTGSTLDFACEGNCKNVKVIAPQSWATRKLTCSSGVCICQGSCAGLSVTFY